MFIGLVTAKLWRIAECSKPSPAGKVAGFSLTDEEVTNLQITGFVDDLRKI